MKKTAKKLILIFLIVLVCIVSIALCVYFALNNGTKGLKYKSNGDGTCYVSGIGKATDTEIIIPILSPGGSFVTGIADSAFEGCDKIESIELHGGIKYIGADAFYNCHALKLVEAGEAIDIVKKHLAQGHELEREKLIKELGDVAWYLAETAYALDVPLEDVLQRNIDKLRARYPQGFEVKRSIERTE